jgi:diguanylate cyclase (GGDEF)-like protein
MGINPAEQPDSQVGSKDRHRTQLLAVAAGVGIAAFSLGRAIQGRWARMQREKQELEEMARTLRHRNNQLSALYNVFSEITQTLSMKYVVEATLREALNLMEAQGTVLWLIRDGKLIPEGSLTSAGRPVRGLEPQILGEGLSGRTARRGQTLRINDDNLELLSEAQRAQGLRSGMLVPLIVGARVVGLLNCWSVTPNAFSDEDQRILEMMASQVATAVVAADSAEISNQRAHHDALTGLPNRLQLAEDLQADALSNAREHPTLVAAMIDIDHFKRFNDDFGHSVGDVTLQKVASLLRHCVRSGDKVYRYGGEEFVVFFQDAGLTEAHALAERLRQAVEVSPFSGRNLEPVGPVTISIGLAARPEHGSDAAHLIDLADKAMYRAKQSGRNCVVSWRSEAEAELEIAA